MRSKPQTSIALSSDLLARLDAQAKAQKRTRTAQIEWYVERGLEADERAEKTSSSKPQETP